MVGPHIELARALRLTAERLRGDVGYQWGHMGECNCGHLAQTITKLSKGEIHAFAMERMGDWEQQAYDYCPTSGYRIDDIITLMLDSGMSIHDIAHLEKLSDPEVLMHLRRKRAQKGDEQTVKSRHLRRNRREDVVCYMEAWAELIEARLSDRAHQVSVAVAA